MLAAMERLPRHPGILAEKMGEDANAVSMTNCPSVLDGGQDGMYSARGNRMTHNMDKDTRTRRGRFQRAFDGKVFRLCERMCSIKREHVLTAEEAL